MRIKLQSLDHWLNLETCDGDRPVVIWTMFVSGRPREVQIMQRRALGVL